MTDLRFRQLVSFIAMHPGPFLVHDSKGTENAAVVAALIRMLLFKETSGATVYCLQWRGLMRWAGRNFRNEIIGMVTRLLGMMMCVIFQRLGMISHNFDMAINL